MSNKTATVQNRTFSEYVKPETIERHKEFSLFRATPRDSISNEYRGQIEGLDFVVFEYIYITGTGQHKHGHAQTVFSVTNRRSSLPNFILSPENIFHKIGQLFGYEDIDFETFPKFSKNYLLKGEKEFEIRGAFKTQVLEYFSGTREQCVENLNDTFIYYIQSKRYKADQIDEFIQKGYAVYRLFIS